MVDIERVVRTTRELPHVIFAESNTYTCEDDTQKLIKERITEHRLNRIVVASCTPRTHEPIFREMLRDAGLNPYLLEMANIRDQCSWVHSGEPERATDKAIDLVRMATARASRLLPLEEDTVPVNNASLVIGGGIAGMTAALAMADQGFPVHLVEKTGELGGTSLRHHRTLDGQDVGKFLAGTITRVRSHNWIKVHLNTRVDKVGGHVGDFSSTLVGDAGTDTVRHGVVVVATGATELRPQTYGYGQCDRVLTQLELSDRLGRGEISLPENPTIAMIQCVEQRSTERPYCSRVCCTSAVRNALHLKERYPGARIIVLYRDMRTFGFREAAYREAREKGILFVRYDPSLPPSLDVDGRMELRVLEPSLGRELQLAPDLVVLAAPMIPRADRQELSELAARPPECRRLLPGSPHEASPGGFRQRRAVPLRHGTCAEVPRRSDRPGPRGGRPGGVHPLPEEDAGERPDGLGRSGQMHLLHDVRTRLPVHGAARQRVPESRDARGGVHGLRQLHRGMPREGHHAPALHGRADPGRNRRPAAHGAHCGRLGAPLSGAGGSRHPSLAQESGGRMNEEPLILAFCCHYCAYAAADLAGSMRLQYPGNVRVLRLPCTGKLEVNFILAAFERGVDGVIVAGCLEGGCHFLEGNLRARRRVERTRDLLAEIGLEPERLEMFNLSSAEGTRFAEIATIMVERVKSLGRSPLRPEAKRIEQEINEISRQAEAMLEGEKR